MTDAVRKCGHPRTPENTCGVSVRAPGGLCRICRLASYARYNRAEKGRARCAERAANGKQRAYDVTRDRAAEGRLKRERKRTYEMTLFAEAPEKRIAVPAAGRVVILSDLQIPFEDVDAVNEALDVLYRVNPDTVILNGDVVDCYAESAFLTDPAKARASIPETHERTRKLLAALAHVPKKLWLGGNHEARWRKLLWGSKGPTSLMLLREHQEAAGSSGIDVIDPDASFAKLFELDKYGFTYYPYSHRLYLADGNLVVTHGKYVSRHSGYSAKRTWEWLGTSCIVGHTHRMGTYLVTQDGREMGAWENGCLCQLEPEYDDTPNWQQGFSVVNVNGPEFHVVPVPIIRRGKVPVAVYHGEVN